MSRRKIRGEARYLTKQIEAHGFQVVFADRCEDAETPGLLGTIWGKTDHDKKVVTIALETIPTRKQVAATLRHELHHVADPEWDCGSRNEWRDGCLTIKWSKEKA